MAESATRKAPVRGGVAARDNFLPPLHVRYYRCMKRQRVYPVVVTWKEAERGVPGKEITLRLLVAGAQVVPSEQTLNPADPEDSVIFHITPVALGKLGKPRLEVLSQGRKVQEMHLPCRVASQRLTWFFFAMAFLLPWLLLHYCKNYPLRDGLDGPGAALQSLIASNVPRVPPQVTEAVPDVEDWLKSLREGIGDTYQELCDFCLDFPLPFYVGCVFLFLSLASAWWQADKRKKRMGKPIPVAAREA